MFLYKFEIPKRMTTDFYAVTGGVEAGYAERLVAIQGPNDKYCLRKGAKVKDQFSVDALLGDPFSLVHGVSDRFNNYSNYTLTLREAYTLLKVFEESRARQARPFDRPRDALHISGFPLVMLDR